MKRHFITLIAGLTLYSHVSGQSNCRDALYESNKHFETGNFNECIQLLEPCVLEKQPLFKRDRDVAVESYHLLAMAYLANNDQEAAMGYIRMILLNRRDYQKFPNLDPSDFSRLVNKFEVTPKIIVAAKVGFNVNSVALKKSYATYNTPQHYNPVTGYQFGVSADYRLKKSLGIQADLQMAGIGIQHVIDNAAGWAHKYQEDQTYLNITLGINHTHPVADKITLKGGLGFGAGYMVQSNVYFKATNNETGSFQESTQDPVSMRNRIQPFAAGTLGIYTPLPKGTIGLETSFSYYFKTTVDPDKRMNDLNFIFNNQYVNDDISLRPLAFNLVFTLPVSWEVSLKK